MELSYGKVLAAITLCFATFMCSMLPFIFLKKTPNQGRSRNFRVVNFLSCFGGGVFMATCLLHLFPDVNEQMVLIFKKLNVNPNYPVAEFLLGFGCLTVLIVEQIILNCQENGTPENVSIMAHNHSHEPYQTYSVEPHSHSHEPYQNYNAIPHSHSHGPHQKCDDTNVKPHSHSHEPYQNYGAINDEPHRVNISLPVDSPHYVSEPIEGNTVDNHEVSFHQDTSSVLHSLLLVFALSLHSIFEGLAIGLQSTAESVIRILLAVIIHKCIIAFTLGLNLANSNLGRMNAIKGIIFFSLTSPIGIIIGLVVVDFVTGLPMLITSGVLQGLAAGTFLYVTFFEILPEEINSSKDRMIKMGCLVLGFSVVAILLLFLPS